MFYIITAATLFIALLFGFLSTLRVNKRLDKEHEQH